MGRVKIYNSLEEAKEAKKTADKERRKRNSDKIKEWNEFEKYGMIKQMRYVVQQLKKEETEEGRGKPTDEAPSSDGEHSQ